MARKAIVMGATSGIGMEVAKLLAEQGWLVGIAGRRVERLEAIKQSHEGIVCYQQIDVTSPDAPQCLLELIEALGGMDLYFHSSGIGWQNNSLDIEKELKTVETNGMGFVRMVDTAFNWFAERDASTISVGNESSVDSSSRYRIACITSIAGTKGLGAAPAYSSTKRFQSHYLECLSQQARIRHLNISITDIRPGFVKTDLIAGSNYPLQLDAKEVARSIVKAMEKGRSVKVIDWRYAILVFFWRLIPRWIWVRMMIFSIIFMLTMSSCQPKVCQIQDKTFCEMVNKNNDFSWNLFREASDSASSVISPISVTYLLSMTLNGTEGKTAEEIKTIMGWKGMSNETINSFCYRLMNSEITKNDSVLRIANYIALNKDASFRHSFVKMARSIYDAQVENLDFSDQSNTFHINDWCKRQTDGMIPSMIDEISPSAVSYLLNVISFNDNWEKPFLELNTEIKPFHSINHRKNNIKMMTNDKDDFLYMEDGLLSAISLPYKDGKYSMLFILPQENHSLQDIKELVNNRRFQHILRQMKMQKDIDLWIPKFTIDKQIPLKEILSSIGLTAMFNPQLANFQKLSSNNGIYVSDMRQKARIEVTEKGTKAAAVTFESMSLSLLSPQNQKVFHADHPFIYVIRDNISGAILFIGQYTGV